MLVVKEERREQRQSSKSREQKEVYRGRVERDQQKVVDRKKSRKKSFYTQVESRNKEEKEQRIESKVSIRIKEREVGSRLVVQKEEWVAGPQYRKRGRRQARTTEENRGQVVGPQYRKRWENSGRTSKGQKQRQ